MWYLFHENSFVNPGLSTYHVLQIIETIEQIIEDTNFSLQ